MVRMDGNRGMDGANRPWDENGMPVPMYDDGQIQVYHGDCVELAPRLPKVDLLLTDPPYGIKVAKRGIIGSDPGPNSKRSGWKVKAKCTRWEPVTWDDAPPPPWMLGLLRSRATHQIIWGGNYFEGLPGGPGWLVWDKVNGATSFADCELAWTNLRKAVRMIKYRWSGMVQQAGRPREKRVHPTQKPVGLMEWCIGQVPGVATILDPFMGSGSVLLAAKKLGLRAIGIDSHRPYCERAIERLAAAG